MQELLIIILLLVIIGLLVLGMFKKDDTNKENLSNEGTQNHNNQEVIEAIDNKKQDLMLRLELIDKEFIKIETKFGEVVEKQINLSNTTKTEITKTLSEAQEKTLKELSVFQEKTLKELSSSQAETLKELSSSQEKTLKELSGFQNLVMTEIHENNKVNLESNNNQREQVIKIIGEKLETSTQKFISLSNQLIKDINDELKKEIELNAKNKEEIINEVRNSLAKNHKETISENQQFLDRIEKRFTESQTYVTQTVGELKKEIGSLVEKQDNLTNLENTIKEFNNVLSNSKLRGLFGEQNLEAILTNYYGENSNFWQRQYKLESGMMPDAVIMCPEPINNIAIDAKFPLDNYRKMMEPNISDIDRKAYQKKFATDLKNRIKEVAKYTKSKELANQAILFIPAEAIFIEVCANYPEIIELGYKDNIWIAGPTTLMAILTTIKMSVEKVHLNANAEKILASLDKLGDEFTRYETRNNDLDKWLDKLVEERRTAKITTNKLITEFTKIKNLK